MWSVLLGIGIGAGLGYVYYRLVGCPSGACPITRNPYTSMLYGAVLGGLMANRKLRQRNNGELLARADYAIWQEAGTHRPKEESQKALLKATKQATSPGQNISGS